MYHIGNIIKKNRLRQNLSQESLCSGICVVSYLSKIENGLVEANQEIIKQLFLALSIDYCDDAALIQKSRAELIEVFNMLNRLVIEDVVSMSEHLSEKMKPLRYSELSIELDCFAFIHQDSEKDFENYFDESMKNPLNFSELSLKYLYYIMGGFFTKLTNRKKGLQYLNDAVRLFPDFIFTYQLGNAYFFQGNYQKSILTMHDALNKAIHEGNLNGMIYSCMMLGNCYSCLHATDLMQQYYMQAIHLAGKEHEVAISDCNYNLGATYLQNHEYEKAKEHFDVCFVSDEKREVRDNFLLYHRRALLAIALGEDATSYITLARSCHEDLKDELNQLVFDWLLRANEVKDHVHDETYLNQLEKIIKLGETKLGYGFIIFYTNYLIEAYKANRRYKDALNLYERLNFLSSLQY